MAILPLEDAVGEGRGVGQAFGLLVFESSSRERLVGVGTERLGGDAGGVGHRETLEQVARGAVDVVAQETHVAHDSPSYQWGYIHYY